MMTDALVLALHRYAEGGKIKQLNLIAQALVNKALEGDVPAIKEVFERTDGKVTQAFAAAIEGELTVKWQQ